jgi:hypothetical protein
LGDSGEVKGVITERKRSGVWPFVKYSVAYNFDNAVNNKIYYSRSLGMHSSNFVPVDKQTWENGYFVNVLYLNNNPSVNKIYGYSYIKEDTTSAVVMTAVILAMIYIGRISGYGVLPRMPRG